VRQTEALHLEDGEKVCEDWASILLNEKTEIVISDGSEKKDADGKPVAGVSSVFVEGKDGTGGVLGEIKFWSRGNELVEKAFAMGAGAFVVKLTGMQVQGETVLKNVDTKIGLDYLPATHIIPLTVRGGAIIEVAFASEVMEQGKPYLYLETHTLDAGKYVITNQYFSIENDQMTEKSLPVGIAPVIRTGSDVPLFAIFSPNIVKPMMTPTVLGCRSICAGSTITWMGVDLTFNKLLAAISQAAAARK
jgi:hypothetical protein